MSVLLGREATLSVGPAGTVVGVRNVTFSQTARTIDIEAYGSRFVSVYQTGYEASVSFEVNDTASIGAINTAMRSGAVVTVSGGAGGWGFPAVITAISETDPIDGVATFQVEARMTQQGTR